MTRDRLQMLWLAATEGLQASRDDVLDLIDEIQYLRATCDLPVADFTNSRTMTVVIGSDQTPDPWETEWPPNP